MPLSQKKIKQEKNTRTCGLRCRTVRTANIAAPLPEFRELGCETIEEELQEGQLYRTLYKPAIRSVPPLPRRTLLCMWPAASSPARVSLIFTRLHTKQINPPLITAGT
jgi:hypothetical protein